MSAATCEGLGSSHWPQECSPFWLHLLPAPSSPVFSPISSCLALPLTPSLLHQLTDGAVKGKLGQDPGKGRDVGKASLLLHPQPHAVLSFTTASDAATYRLPCPCRSVFWVYNWCAFSGVLCVSSGELISGCNPPGRCRPSRIP